MLKDYLAIVLGGFKNRKLRSFLTALGIIIGIALIFILISLGQGMQNSIEEQFNKLGVRAIRVVPGHLNGPPTASIGFDKSLQEKIEQVKGVDYVNPVLLQDDIIIFNNEGVFVTITGYDTKLSDKGFVDTDTKLDSGRFFTVDEKDSVLIGYNIANDLYNKKIRVKNSVEIQGNKFKVAGIFEKTGTDIDSQVYMPLETLRYISGEENLVNAFVVQVKDGIALDPVAKSIRDKLKRVFKSEDEYQVFTPEQLIAQIQSILGAISIVLIAIAAISIFVGAIGIMNSMYASVLERTREIGVMKAVGAKRSNILLLFLLESGIIGLVGGIIGITIGIIVSLLVDSVVASLGYSVISIKIDPILILFSLLFSLIIGLFSGLLPSLSASKLQAIDALRYE